jgi:hypothetical protein
MLRPLPPPVMPQGLCARAEVDGNLAGLERDVTL